MRLELGIKSAIRIIRSNELQKFNVRDSYPRPLRRPHTRVIPAASRGAAGLGSGGVSGERRLRCGLPKPAPREVLQTGGRASQDARPRSYPPVRQYDRSALEA